jgi:hypothetical protein
MLCKLYEPPRYLSLPAMRESNQSPAFLTVSKGAVVETSYDLDYPGLVRIKLQGQPLFAFIRDLRESAEPV